MTQVGIRGPYETMRFGYYVCCLGFDPADLTNYFFGGRIAAPTALAAVRIVEPGIAGRITGASVLSYASTAIGTAENISLYLRLNDATDYLIETVGLAVNIRRFRNFALNIPVIATDFFEIKMVCPTWVTNPQGVFFWGNVYFET